MITVKQAQALTLGTVLYHVENSNADGTPQRWRVSGRPKTWKTDPSRFRVPVKHGFNNHGALETEGDLDLLCLTEVEACGVRASRR